MSKFEREMFAKPGDDAGVFIQGLAEALTTWAAMNLEQWSPITVREAANAFNTTDAVIREACEAGAWISWSGPEDEPLKQIIELDGE